MSIRRVMAAAVALAVTCVPSVASAAPTPSGVTSPDVVLFAGTFSAKQVAAGSASTATGTATVRIDLVNNTITTDASWSGLTGNPDRSHVHSGAQGQPFDGVYQHEVMHDDARTVIPCDWPSPDFPEACAPATGSLHDETYFDYGSVALPEDQYACPDWECALDILIPAGFYIDIHTQLYPKGEIRAQLVHKPQRPDARVRAGTAGDWIGDGIYAGDARRQVVTSSAPRGTTLTFQTSIQNDNARFPDTFDVLIWGDPTAGYSVKVLVAGKNVTGSVRAGTYHTESLAPGASVTLTVKITIAKLAGRHSSTQRTLMAISQGDAARVDAVKIIAKRS